MFDFNRGTCDVTGVEWAAIDSLDTSYFVVFYPETKCGASCLVQVGKYQAITRHDTASGEIINYHVESGLII